jgi:hypothetical protein
MYNCERVKEATQDEGLIIIDILRVTMFREQSTNKFVYGLMIGWHKRFPKYLI